MGLYYFLYIKNVNIISEICINYIKTLLPRQLNAYFTSEKALLQVPALRLTAMLRMLKTFTEDLFGDDDFIGLNSHVFS